MGIKKYKFYKCKECRWFGPDYKMPVSENPVTNEEIFYCPACNGKSLIEFNIKTGGKYGNKNS
ncbi:MAG: hypothetical protein GY853_15700 [PVC group bacterium]|nr:hypothetical protein [PVC group bacterium]